MPRIHPAVTVAFVTGVHFVVSVLLLLYVFGTGMARFDTGAAASFKESLAGWTFTVLSFPLLMVLERIPPARFPGLWGYVPFLLNASVWGVAAGLVHWRRRARLARATAR